MLERLIKKLRIKVSNLITRCILLKDAVEIDGQMFIQVEGLKDEIISDVEHRQQYGFRSRPPKGTRGILLAIGGDKSNATAILADSKEIEKLPAWDPGEVRQFNDQGIRHRMAGVKHILDVPNGDQLVFEDSKMLLTIGGTTFEFTSTGLLVTGGDVKADTISLKTHKQIGSASAPDGPVTNTGTPIP